MLTVSTLLLASPLALVARAQEKTGTWFINASTPANDAQSSGCVILAQLTTSSSPPTLQSLYPICPSTTPVPSDPSTGVEISWPLVANEGNDDNDCTNAGDGLQASLAIYGQIQHKEDRTDAYMAQAGCVMVLDKDQVQYILGRSLTWNNNLELMWDNTANGFIATKDGSANMTCGQDDALLPETLWLPDPYVVDSTETVWKSPIQLEVPKAKTTASSTAVAGIQTQVVTSVYTIQASTVTTVYTITETGANDQPTGAVGVQTTTTTGSSTIIGGGLLAQTTSSAAATAVPADDGDDDECEEDDRETVTKTVTVTGTGDILTPIDTQPTSTIGGGLLASDSANSTATIAAIVPADSHGGDDDCEGEEHDHSSAWWTRTGTRRFTRTGSYTRPAAGGVQTTGSASLTNIGGGYYAETGSSNTTSPTATAGDGGDDCGENHGDGSGASTLAGTKTQTTTATVTATHGSRRRRRR